MRRTARRIEVDEGAANGHLASLAHRRPIAPEEEAELNRRLLRREVKAVVRQITEHSGMMKVLLDDLDKV